MKKPIALFALLCAAAFAQQKGAFTDSRDGKTYKTVKISEQVWMAENLNFNANGSKCYENKPENCKKYGRLYDWNVAKESCPQGWHLPSDGEWTTLTDAYGFAALPGGHGYPDGGFYYVGEYSIWWSATEYDADDACYRFMGSDLEDVGRGIYDKRNLLSVRCAQGNAR